MFFNQSFGFDGHSSNQRKNVDNTKFYKLLGVNKDANSSQIKKAFYKLAKTHHPDKGGDVEKFKEMQYAYETLSDEDKRRTYDEYGEEGLAEGGMQSGGVHDIFDLFTGRTSCRNKGKNRKQRGKDEIFKLNVSLEDLYNGANKKLRLYKNIICTKCLGSGTKSGKSSTCKFCDGSGICVKTHKIGPGMIQQVQAQCDSCNGSGEAMLNSDRCPCCHGRKVVKQEKELKVFIEKGMNNRQKIVFTGEADEHPNTLPGDVVVHLMQKDHPIFGRDGLNLFIQKKISLVEALTGCTFMVKHLDGRLLKVSTCQNGKIIKPNQVLCVENEGMPQQKHIFSKGALFIEFLVEFPKDNCFCSSDIKKLKSVLPSPINSTIHNNTCAEEVTLSDASLEEVRKRQKAYKEQNEAYDEDEGGAEDHEMPGAQCRTQ